VTNCSFSNLPVLLIYVINYLRITRVYICIGVSVYKMCLLMREFQVDYEYRDVFN